MTNAARQEVDLKLGGKTYTVKPTFEVIAGIEQATGFASIALADQCYGQGPSALPPVSRIVMIMEVLLASTQKGITPTRTEIGEQIMEYGMMELLPQLGDFLSRALQGHKEHMRKATETAKGELVTDPPKDS